MSNVSGNYKLHPKQWKYIRRQLEAECNQFERSCRERAHEWGPRVYHALTPLEHIEWCATMPQGFIHKGTHFDVQLDGMDLRLELPREMPIDHSTIGGYNTFKLRPEHHLEAYHALLAIARETRQASQDGDHMVQELQSIYDMCTVLKDLVVVWPEATRYMVGAVKRYTLPRKPPEARFTLSDRTKVFLVKLKLMRK